MDKQRKAGGISQFKSKLQKMPESQDALFPQSVVNKIKLELKNKPIAFKFIPLRNIWHQD